MTAESRVRILQVPDCPLVGRLIEDVERCLADLEVEESAQVVTGDFPSPTLEIDGVDVVTGAAVAGDPRCRMDLPSGEQIRAAVAQLPGGAKNSRAMPSGSRKDSPEP